MSGKPIYYDSILMHESISHLLGQKYESGKQNGHKT